MKILFITYPMAFHTPGGGEIQLLAYKKHLELNGIEVDLFDPWKPSFLKYDLVHFFSVIGGSIHLCNFIKNLNIPLIISSSLWITEDIKHNYPFNEIKEQLLLADVVVSNSDVESYNMSEILELPLEKFKTVYNGVEDIFLKRIDKDIFLKKYNITDKFILNVGNIEERKNQLNLAYAMKDFPNYKLILIGHIRDNNYFNKLKEILKNQLIYIDYINNNSELLRSAYSACDLFCLPSTLETPGLAALEAYVSGANIVITKIGATKEYFRENVFYTNPNKINDISESIKLALKNNINNTNTNIYTWDDNITELINIYKNLIAKKVKNEK
jgi:glycosyltransferase involved in cell wall biosynthesis